MRTKVIRKGQGLLSMLVRGQSDEIGRKLPLMTTKRYDKDWLS